MVKQGAVKPRKFLNLLWMITFKGKGGDINIICTQPRRLAAIGVAERVAAEQCCHLGDTIGYQIRMDNLGSKKTRLTFVTTGILLRNSQ